MILKSSVLAQANKGFRALFFQALEQEASLVDKIIGALAMQVQSTGTSEEYKFADTYPKMEEWKAERPMQQLGVESFALTNVTYANGIQVFREEFEDDKLGLVAPRIQALAVEAARHRLELMETLINNAFSGTGYDGVAFFSASHPRKDGGSNQNNLGSGALSASNYEAAMVKLHSIKDNQGRLLRNRVSHLICGVDNEVNALEILQAERGSSGSTNVLRGSAQLLVVPGLTTGYWAVADLSKPLKPLVWQTRRAVEFAALDSLTDEEVFKRRILRWGADYRGVAGYGFWQLMVGSTGS